MVNLCGLIDAIKRCVDGKSFFNFQIPTGKAKPAAGSDVPLEEAAPSTPTKKSDKADLER